MTLENITLVIRLGTTTRFTIPSSASNDKTINVNSTISDVKSLIALEDACDKCPVERQRLIYKGRILSDDSRTLSDYGVAGDNQTLHLVKGSAPRSTAPAPAPSTVPAPTPTAPPASVNPPPSFTPPPPTPGGGSNAGFMDAMRTMMQQNNGAPPDMSQMQRQLLQNPEMMSSLMSSPMMQSMMSNPDVIRMMMESNPEMRRVLDSNPQLRHILDDPELMRRSMEMMRDPSVMQNAMRNQDLAMSQIENVPGGFNALRRMYEEVQEPMMDAMAGSGTREDNNSGVSQSTTSGGAMPNPWGAPSSSSSNTTLPSSGGGMPSIPPPSTLPNPWTPATSSSAANPWANPAAPDLNRTIEMLENPLVNNMMQNILNDPEALRAMTENNPALAQIRQANPAAAAMMSNPDTLRQMLNPNNLRALNQIQEGMRVLQGSGMGAGMPGMPPIPDMSGMGTVPGPTAPGANLDFSSLLNSFQSANLGGPPVPPPRNMAPPEERFRHQLQSLNDMGFSDREANIRALTATNGNINRAVEHLLSEPAPAPAPADN